MGCLTQLEPIANGCGNFMAHFVYLTPVVGLELKGIPVPKQTLEKMKPWVSLY
jgi:hypothetical protein